METKEIQVGIYFNSAINKERIGALVKLENVLRRYPEGQADIVAKSVEGFTLDEMHKCFREKLYPGGYVRIHGPYEYHVPSLELFDAFTEYMERQNLEITSKSRDDIFELASNLSLNLSERYKLLVSHPARQELILKNRIKFLMHLTAQEEKSRDVYHLN